MGNPDLVDMAILAEAHHTAFLGSHMEESHEMGHQDRSVGLEDSNRRDCWVAGGSVVDLADQSVRIDDGFAVGGGQEVLSALGLVVVVWRSI